MFTLLLGGARSGKSRLAVQLATRTLSPVAFIATAEALDAEFAERIERHRLERPAGWTTHEVPVDVAGALSRIPDDDTVIVDCLTLWIANLQRALLPDGTIEERAAQLAKLASDRSGTTIVVSNEVGSGVVPADALARRYCDLLGGANRTFASVAQRAYLVVAGRTLRLEPSGEL